MKLKLFSGSTVGQLSRLFANANIDDKSCYLVSLNSGFTENDLNKCLNYQTATGSGYMFDAALAASTGICKVLAKGTNCVRTISAATLAISDCTLTATAEGVPTHLILGGVLPICLQVGPDVTLLYPDLNIKFDPNGYKTTVTILAFGISLSKTFSDLNSWIQGNEIIALDKLKFSTPSFLDYMNNNFAVTGNAVLAADGLGIDLGTTGVLSVTGTFINPSQSYTIDFMYHQQDATRLAEFNIIKIGTTLTNRFTVALDFSNEGGLLVWNNVGGGVITPRVQRPIDNYAAMKSTTPIKIKYVYDATTNMHSFYANGVLMDSFAFANLQPVASGHMVTGGYGAGANATYTPIIDQYGVRQGAY